MSISGKNHIGFGQSAQGSTVLRSRSAADASVLDGAFVAATSEEVDQAMAMAKRAFQPFALMHATGRAEFLEAIAHEIEAMGDALVQRASAETGLPEGRFVGERGRTTGQLRQFAAMLRSGNWQSVTMESALPNRTPLPRPDLRKMMLPLGPVVVFTASNFPLAFSTAGGDTAAALAAGCPVVVKAHEGHLGVNDMVAGAISRAAEATGMPEGVFSSLNGQGHELGKALVLHPSTAAVAFTGSLGGGRALYDLAQGRQHPIPVFAEMGSVNPVVLLPEKIRTEGEALAAGLAGSITMGVGQFCTNPGLLLAVDSEHYNAFKIALAGGLNQAKAHTMLNEGIAANYAKCKSEALQQAGVSEATAAGKSASTPTLAEVSGSDFLDNPRLHHEVFGPFSLLVKCATKAELLEVLDALEGQLTGTIMGTEDELPSHLDVLEALQFKVGRVIFNGAPTGVEVCGSMQHGGPYPATTDSRFTSVGTGAIQRFLRPVCYQNIPESALPEVLKSTNPTGITRTMDGQPTAP